MQDILNAISEVVKEKRISCYRMPQKLDSEMLQSVVNEQVDHFMMLPFMEHIPTMRKAIEEVQKNVAPNTNDLTDDEVFGIVKELVFTDRED